MQASDRLLGALSAHHIPHRRGAALSHYTTFRIGGPAALLVEPGSEEQLITSLRLCTEAGIPPFLLGRGSNVLLPDEGLDGVVIRTSGVCQIEVSGTELTAACGTNLSEVCVSARTAGLSGLEFAYGIPGTMGGAVYMNAGAYGGQISDIVRSVVVYDRGTDEILTLVGEEMEFSYRHSRLQREGERTVLRATLALQRDEIEAIRARMEDYMARRRDKQPLDYPSAGSTFKRPEGSFAGALIEQSGLKGYTVGGAMVSPKHAGFIVNIGSATAEDVCRLIEHVRTVVRRDHGIELEPEIQIMRAHLARTDRE